MCDGRLGWSGRLQWQGVALAPPCVWSPHPEACTSPGRLASCSLILWQEIEGAKRAKRDRSEQAEEERHARMLREQIERAQKMARTSGGDGEDAAAAAADPAATELRRDALKDQPLGFQLAKARAAAAMAAEHAAAAPPPRPKPAAAFAEDDGGGGAGPSGRGGSGAGGPLGGGGKKSKIEELMEKVGGVGCGLGGCVNYELIVCVAATRPACAAHDARLHFLTFTHAWLPCPLSTPRHNRTAQPGRRRRPATRRAASRRPARGWTTGWHPASL